MSTVRDPSPPPPAAPVRRTLARGVGVVATFIAAAILPAPAHAQVGPDATAFEPVAPCRLLDTRESGAAVRHAVTVDVAGRCGVPAGAVAAAVTVTAVRPVAAGYLAVSPAGRATDASALNFRTGQVVANLQLVALGEGGALEITTTARTDLVVDVNGAFVPVEGPTSAGRFVAFDPERVLDTRSRQQPAAGEELHVDTGVPVDAIAVVANVTATRSRGFDFLTAFETGTPRPDASVLNLDAPNQSRAATVIVGVHDGRFDVATATGSHVIVDVLGYFTGESASAIDTGLFVPIPPTRLVDTRAALGPFGGPRLYDGGAREFDVEIVTGGPVGAVAANVTVTRTEDRGFVTVGAAGVRRDETSTVNYSSAALTIANQTMSRVSDRGLVVDASEATHVVVDLTGWFIGSPAVARQPVPPNDPPPLRRVVLIGDSAFAGIRWNGALAGLQGMVVDQRLESCRRLVEPSCRGREGVVPRTVVEEIVAMPRAGTEDILVVTAGYDDWHAGFSADFDAVVATARARGYHHIAWVTYRSHVGYVLVDGEVSNYGEMNRIMSAKVASGRFPDVRVWDFDADTSSDPEGWFYADGIHQRPLGSWGAADWLSRHVAAFDDRACPQPWVVGRMPDQPCPTPGAVLATGRGLPDIAAIYGL